MLISIRNKEDQKSLSKKTRDIITSIAEDSFARMIAFIPDDDLIVSYRPEKAKIYSFIKCISGTKNNYDFDLFACLWKSTVIVGSARG